MGTDHWPALHPLMFIVVGGPGPRIESWAYAVDELGLEALQDVGAHNVRGCKGCKASPVVVGVLAVATGMVHVLLVRRPSTP